MQETWIGSLGGGDPLGEEVVTYSNIPAWEIPWTVQFSCSVVSDSLRPHARLPCPSPTPRTCLNSCPLSRWCHPTISSSVIPFSSCLQPFPASGSFQMSQFFASGGQSIGASGLISFRIDWLDFLAVQGTLKSLLQHHSSKASILNRSAFFMVQLSHPYMTTRKTTALHLLRTLFLMWCHCWSDERNQWACGPEVGDPCYKIS